MRTIRIDMTQRNPENGQPLWLTFIWNVNDLRPGTFGRPVLTTRNGYLTESYDDGEARCRVMVPEQSTERRDPTVRIIADTENLYGIWEQVTVGLGLNIPWGWTEV